MKMETRKERRRSIFSKEVAGWGWMCVLGSFFIHTVIQGCFGRSSGVLQLELETKFGQSISVTALLFSVITALQMLLAPFASTLCNICSCRTAVIVGGVVFTVGLFISAFVPSLWYLFLTFSVIGGIGQSLAYGPSVIIVGQYFKDRSSLPMGIATSGSGCGSFVFPVLVELMFHSYGTSGAFILLSGIALNICVCGMLLRPVAEIRKSSGTADKHFKNIKIDEEPQKKQTIFNILVMRNPIFVLFCIAMMFATANRVLHFIPSIAVSKGIKDIEAVSLLSINGAVETIFHIVSGFLLDFKHLKRHRLLVFTLMLFGIAVFVFSFSHIENFSTFAITMCFHGILSGSLASQKSVVLVDIVGVENLSEGNGLLTFFRGLGVVFGPPAAGILKDITGNYTSTLYLCSSFALTASLLLTVAAFLLYLQRQKEFESEQTTENTHVKT